MCVVCVCVIYVFEGATKQPDVWLQVRREELVVCVCMCVWLQVCRKGVGRRQTKLEGLFPGECLFNTRWILYMYEGERA